MFRRFDKIEGSLGSILFAFENYWFINPRSFKRARTLKAGEDAGSATHRMAHNPSVLKVESINY
tara:strand:- start:11128 stop:11319 length:192 start_codon:yes stop_codon:yes gene_type:complete